MKSLTQALYSTLTALCCILSYSESMPSPQPTIPGFEPSRTQCCKLGESFAKKKLACEFSTKFNVGQNSTASWDKLRFVDHKLNAKITREEMMASAFIRKLMVKADQCTDANFISYTTKCCSYRKRYYRELKLCKTYTDFHKRKLCVSEVRQSYP